MANTFDGVINVKDAPYNAKGDNSTNDQAALQEAFDAGKTQGKAVYIPPGIYKHNSILNVDSIKVFGAGWSSVLKAYDSNYTGSIPPQDPNATDVKGCIYLHGTSPVLENVKVISEGTAKRRSGPDEYEGIKVRGNATDFVVKECWVEKCHGAGILTGGSTQSPYAGSPLRGQILNNVVNHSWADGIHLVDGASEIVVANNTIRNSGDDCIAVVSYSTGDFADKVTKHIIIVNNVCVDQLTAGRGITVIGGTDVTITGNTVKNTFGAGLLIAPETGTLSQHAQCENISVVSNVFNDTGGNSYGSVQLATNSAFTIKNIIVSDNVFTDCRNIGLHINQSSYQLPGTPPPDPINADLRNIKINNNIFKGKEENNTATMGCLMKGKWSNIDITNNTFSLFKDHGFRSDSTTAFGYFRLDNNVFEDVCQVLSNPPTSTHFDVIGMDSITTLGYLSVQNNLHIETTPRTIERFLELGSTTTNLVVYGNKSTKTTAFGAADELGAPSYWVNNRITALNAAPNTGTWKKGDIVYKLNPTSPYEMGWVCVNSGSPGTWIRFCN